MRVTKGVAFAIVACVLSGAVYRAGAAFSPVDHGRQMWFENTSGNERFFGFLANHPDPAKRIRVAFDDVVATPRATRFDTWGTINDPDCIASTDPASPHDVCPDPSASGVIGIRKTTTGTGLVLYGSTCALCHAGFDPLDPPADVNAPVWPNIHPTVGNAHLKTGAIMGNNLAATDPRRLLLAGWSHGTFDSTFLFTDNIMNPETITPIWELRRKPEFDVALPDSEVRSGHGGEDDLGLDVLILRKYLSVGACFAECTVPAMQFASAIALNACRANCTDLPSQADVDDLTTFLDSIDAPQYSGGRNGPAFAAGKQVFASECASCHDNSGKTSRLLSNDEVNALAADAVNATNACRALGTNWDAGKLWADFSSDSYKARGAAGQRGYRTAPLAGIWATGPLLHNDSVGTSAAATASAAARAAAFEQSMLELLSPARTPTVKRTPVQVGPFPAGTPLTFIFSRDAATGALLCSDVVENAGHYYGSQLSAADKAALIEYLKFQ